MRLEWGGGGGRGGKYKRQPLLLKVLVCPYVRLFSMSGNNLERLWSTEMLFGKLSQF